MRPADNDKIYTVKQKRDPVVLGIEVITLVVLIIYASITFGLYCQTKKALRETKRANYVAMRSADAAKQSAGAAKESADATIASERAWLDIVDWRVPSAEQVNKGIGKQIENVGKTPALQPELMEETFFLSTKDSPRPQLTECRNFPSVKKYAIGRIIEAGVPHEVSARKFDRPYSRAEIARFKRHLSGLILHGCITYNLVGSSSKPGVTEFCSIFYLESDIDQTRSCGVGIRME
jgi:hypothetical protein